MVPVSSEERRTQHSLWHGKSPPDRWCWPCSCHWVASCCTRSHSQSYAIETVCVCVCGWVGWGLKQSEIWTLNVPNKQNLYHQSSTFVTYIYTSNLMASLLITRLNRVMVGFLSHMSTNSAEHSPLSRRLWANTPTRITPFSSPAEGNTVFPKPQQITHTHPAWSIT